MKHPGLAQRLRRLVFLDGPGRDPEQREFLVTWTDKLFVQASRLVLIAIMGVSPIGFLIGTLGYGGGLGALSASLNVLMFFAAVYGMQASGLARVRRCQWIQTAVFLGQLAFFAFSTAELPFGEVRDHFALTTVLIPLFTITQVVRYGSFAFLGHLAFYTTSLLLVLGGWDEAVPRHFFIVTLVSLFALIVKVVVVRGTLWLALAEFRASRAELRSQRKAFEHEIELAARIQRSALFEGQRIEVQGTEIEVYQRPHSKVGGDWAAVRTVPGGFVAVIGDATGKGLQASLVVHAVRSLWALAEEEQDLHPLRWMEQVDKALLRLGRREPHTMTMGILECRGREWTYLSAGHVPLIQIEDDGRPKTHMARGNPLGLPGGLELVPCKGERGPGNLNLLMASDGLYDVHAYSRRSIRQLAARMKTSGLDVLNGLETDDDLSAIWIRTVSRISSRKTEAA